MRESTLNKVSEELIELAASGHTAPAVHRPATSKLDALHEHRLTIGWKPVGRKIGFTNRSIWPIYDVHEPIWGYVYDRTLVHSGNECVVALDGLMQPRIEPEISFRLKSAPRSSRPDELLRCLDWVAHSIEIVQCAQPGWKGLTAAGCTAENGLHGCLVVGTPFPFPRSRSCGRVACDHPRAAQGRDGNRRGTGDKVLGSPLLALGFLVEMLSGDERLAAGEIVTTGTLTDAHAVAAGETWTTEIRGLPLAGLKVSFR
jgi:2-keto-4-pentenoate hydratase